MHYEVEQKFVVRDAMAIEVGLRALGAESIGVTEQVDQYFNHPARDFARTDEALRLRRSGDENLITYKGPKVDSTTKTRREIELPLLAGPDVLPRYGELLQALGFRPVAEVRKTRREFEIAWQGRTIEVAIDDVTDVGTYLELELSAGESEIETARSAIAALAAELGLAQSERRSYLELLLEQC